MSNEKTEGDERHQQRIYEAVKAEREVATKLAAGRLAAENMAKQMRDAITEWYHARSAAQTTCYGFDVEAWNRLGAAEDQLALIAVAYEE